jgi:hypothetical protein
LFKKDRTSTWSSKRQEIMAECAQAPTTAINSRTAEFGRLKGLKEYYYMLPHNAE